MAGKHVFISHSQHDKEMVNAICNTFEAQGVSCWVAPRDVTPGERYPLEIIKGIENSSVFLLLLSKYSNESRHVLSEVEITFSNKIPIVTVLLEETEPAKVLRYYLQVYQMVHLQRNPSKNELLELVELVNKQRFEYPVHPEFKPVMNTGEVISNDIYPLARALNDIREQELSDNESGINNAIFRLNNVLIRIVAICFIACLRKIDDKNLKDKEIYYKLIKINKPNTNTWINILETLAEELNFHAETPLFVKNFITQFMKDCGALDKVNKALQLLQKSLQSAYHGKNEGHVLCLLKNIAIYEEDNQCKGHRIENASLTIKSAFLEIINNTDCFCELNLIAVKSISPNKDKKLFEHHCLLFNGMDPTELEKPLITKDWEIIESQSVILCQKDNDDIFLNLSPFIVTTSDFSDLMIWERTDDFKTITRSQIRDKIQKQHEIDDIDPLLIKVRDLFKTEIIGHSIEINSREDLQRLLEETITLIEHKVTNPICMEEFKAKISAFDEQLKQSIYSNSIHEIHAFAAKINQLKKEMLRGEFYKLVPTDDEFILSDRHKGKYIIAEKFYQLQQERNPEFDLASNLFKKTCTNEVKALLMLAYIEAGSLPLKVFGVEH
ncbi:MAG: toll/interleukin-1 receptor domain-containing protein, partial [Calditrichaeota bacterium]